MSLSALPPASILTGARPEMVNNAILARVIASLHPQSSAVMLNSNEPAAFAHTGLEVRPAPAPFPPGDLSGIRAAMLWAQERGAPAVLTMPANRPFLPHNLAARLAAANAGGHIAVAVSNGVMHPAIAIWPSALAGALQHEMRNGLSCVRGWLERLPFKAVTFESVPYDPFMRISHPSGLSPAGSVAWHCPAPGERHGVHPARH